MKHMDTAPYRNIKKLLMPPALSAAKRPQINQINLFLLFLKNSLYSVPLSYESY